MRLRFTPPPQSRSAAAVIALLGIALAALLRGSELGCFEFRFEQAMAVLNGLDMPGKYFLINHGMVSSVGFPNGPGLYYLTGIFALLGCREVIDFVAATLIWSLAAAPLLWYGLRKEPVIAPLAALFLGAAPALILLSTNLWAQVYMPLWGVGIYLLARRAERHADVRSWIGAVLLAIAGGLVHLSSFFVLPGLLWIFLRQKFRWRCFAWTAAGGLAMLAPWLWYLVANWKPQRFTDPSGGWRKLGFMLWEYFGAFGGGYLQEYYSWNLTEPLESALSRPGAWLIVALTLILPWIGVGRAILDCRRGNALSAEARTAWILTGSVLGCYLLLWIHVYYFYLFLPAPFLAVLAADGFARFRQPWLRLGIPGVWAAAALLLVGTMLADVNRAGGHPREYGIHYGWWQDFRTELAELRRRHGDFQLQLRFTRLGGGKVDAGTLGYLFGDYFKAAPQRLGVTIDYDPQQRVYRRIYHPPQAAVPPAGPSAPQTP